MSDQELESQDASEFALASSSAAFQILEVPITEPFLVIPTSDIESHGEAAAIQQAIARKYGFEVTDAFARDFAEYLMGRPPLEPPP